MALTTTIMGSTVRGVYDNVKDTFPASTAPTGGTITSGSRLDRLTGVGTSFLTDLEKGDFIWNTVTDELLEVESVCSDTEATLKTEMAGAITTDTFKIVKRTDNRFKTISWVIDATGTAEINTVVYPAETSESIGDTKPNGQGGGRKLSPILVDSTTNSNKVYVTGE